MWPVGWDRIASRTPPCPHGLLHPVHAAVQLHLVEEDDGWGPNSSGAKINTEVPDDIREDIRILETGHVNTSQCLELPCFAQIFANLQVFVIFVQFFF